MKQESKFLEVGLTAVKKAGDILRKYYQRVGMLAVERKNEFFDPGSFVTEADREAENAITQLLKSQFPEHGIWGEENEGNRTEKEYTWYIDPLDGTSNFLRKIPLWGISLGLAKEDVPILGILYFPEEDLLLRASKGRGAFANDKPVHVSKRTIQESLYFARGYFKGTSYFNDRLARKFGQTKILDSSAYELAQIALGNGELYVLPSVPHDVAAGSIIVEEAGGRITDYQGKPWNIKFKDIVVTNGVIHDEVLAILKG